MVEMLTEKEKAGIREILQKMTDYDVRSLAETITNRMVVIQSLEEAYTAVLAYAANALDVLKRRKIKKEYIFQYLYEMGSSVAPNADKKTTILAALTLWESKDAQGELSLVTVEDDGGAMICEDSYTSNISNSLVPPSAGNNSQDVNSIGSDSELNLMAQQFVRWFYPIFNNGHVSNPNAEDNFGPHHFWRDCQLKIHTPQYENLVEGSSAVSQKLLSLIGQHQFYFNPFEAQQGIKSRVDSFGRVIVLVGGALHHSDNYIGLFEQTFGLLRDPSAGNNWKIKFSELRLAVKDLDLNLLDAAENYALEFS